MEIKPYLHLMVEKNASDLFFTPGAPVKIKIDGKMQAVGNTVLTPEMTQEAVWGIMDEGQRKHYEENLEVDFAISLPNKARFRVNAFRQRGVPAMVLRYIKAEVPTATSLGLPDILTNLIMHKRGIILMVGSTGSGKSTTLAAMINHRNENSADHILTIEDPVEFVHPHKKGLINQREVGTDTLSYANALKSSLREAPDVILIGEIRNRETMEAAVELAGTGHLAISTLHANNAHQALDRVINMFPQSLHKQLFMDLALNMRSIISQRLVRGVNGGRCAAIEVLINTPHISELILNGKIDEVREAMEESGEAGMQSFDTALLKLYRDGKISMEEALTHADSRANLEAKVHFG